MSSDSSDECSLTKLKRVGAFSFVADKKSIEVSFPKSRLDLELTLVLLSVEELPEKLQVIPSFWEILAIA